MFDAWIVKFKPFVLASVLIVLFEITKKNALKLILITENSLGTILHQGLVTH